ncbi:MAG TPA: YdcF family protein [Anaerolineaceae bacterium]|nr:YdcF family protein [Anaerolineaceae bacterium]HPN50318.1 YdcF family protein [Anaerolineaceae bacterium]
MRDNNRRSGCLKGILILAVVLAGGFFALWGAGGLLIIADPLTNADAVVVLSGGEGRLAYAADLYRKGYAGAVVITDTGLAGIRSADEREAWRQDVDEEDVWLAPGHASNTIGEAQAVRKLAQEKNIESLIIVTDGFHTQRTRLIFLREVGSMGVKIIVRPVPGHWYQSTTWWLSLAGWRETFSEYAKIALYIFSGQ